MNEMEEYIPGFDDPNDELSGYYDDYGNRLNPDLVAKPALCLLCALDENPHELVLCTLNRLDQADRKGAFECGAFKAKI
ncbi:MAG: hypothetical protein JXA71_07855 [Chitinispirillaceae bacterium]|nr:hypothetical protein [Chitinispirillaceae bacterium]